MTEKAKSSPIIYLAGPEVFLEDSIAIGEEKKRICRNHELIGSYPMDNEFDFSGYSPQENAFRISGANEKLILDADAVIANLTPFRGISADVGTVYELGFAAGLGKRIFAYTNVLNDLAVRTCNALGLDTIPTAGMEIRDGAGMAIESFGLHDNLMLEGGIYARHGILSLCDTNDRQRFRSMEAFEECVRFASSVLHK